MNKISLLVISLLVCLLTLISKVDQLMASSTDIVYGEDNRMDITEVIHPIYLKWAESTVAMIKETLLVPDEFKLNYKIKNTDFAKRLCAEERFRDEVTAANCTGMLVAPDLIVTAGHCMRAPEACEDFRWVFDYNNHLEHVENGLSVASKNIYECAEVLVKKFDTTTREDYAIVKLKRPVLDREPLKIRRSEKLNDNSELVIIGHPSGLPLKIADNATVRSNTNEIFFVTNTDSFQGNSGSPVLNVETGLVEGILVRGGRDYRYDYEQNCFKTVRCTEDDCRGEDVTRITLIGELAYL